MKKKLSIALLTTICALGLAVGLTACSTPEDNDGEKEQHTHTYATEWTYDATYHWHAATCEHTNEVSSKAGHTSENEVCTVCGYTQPTVPHEHTYATEWSSDATYHWHAATCEHTDEVSHKAEHTFENGVCTVCDERKTSQGLEFTLSTDKTYYTVTGIGTCTDADVVIPSVYEGLPVTGIGEKTFLNCVSMQSISVPDSIKSIGLSAFQGCTSLQGVYITDMAAWCDIPFFDTSANPLCSAQNLYLNGELVTDLIIPEGVKTIYGYAFAYAASIQSVSIPASVTLITDFAFGYCTSLTSIEVPDSVTAIGTSVFLGCTSLKNATIGNGITILASTLFSGCTMLESFTIPASVTTIGRSAFGNCSSLTEIVIPDGVTSLGNYAFSGCSSLTSITIGSGVTSMESATFADCHIEIARLPAALGNKLPQTYLKTLIVTEGDMISAVFSACKTLTTVVLPVSVTTICDSAFFGCSSIAAVYYQGTEEDWNKILIQANNEFLIEAARFYYSETDPFEGESAVEEGNFWHYDENGEIVIWSKEN